MDDATKGLSTYELITKLSERILVKNNIHTSNRLVKRLCSQSYEILLSKRVFKNDTVACLEDSRDPNCHILAWCFLLISDYDLREHSNSIKKCVDVLNTSPGFDKGTFENILQFLLQLKNIPEDDCISLDADVNPLPNRFFRHFDERKFRLPDLMKNSGYIFDNPSTFQLRKRKGKSFIVNVGPKYDHTNLSTLQQLDNRLPDEGYESPGKVEDLWETASKTYLSERRTWETLGNPSPEKEPPFLTEVPTATCTLFHNSQVIKDDIFDLQCEPKNEKTISHQQFTMDAKNLLVGIVSNAFMYDTDNVTIKLVPGVTIEGISYSATYHYSQYMIFCGTCYNALNNMIEVDPYSGKHKQNGYIFAELCDSIKRYLSYYRIAAFLLPTSNGVLALHNHIRKLGLHLQVLSSVCKVGPFASTRLPHGVHLLNYLYQQVLGVTNKDVLKVLYSVLYPCLQIYYNLFLRQWILEGYVHDPYNEFFIMPDSKNLGTRGRTYWTRSFTIREKIVPIFISDLQQKILDCGKAMNLLKFCRPNSPTCKYLRGKKPNILQCCITSDQLKMLEKNVSCYYLEVIVESSPRFSIQNLLTRSHDDEKVFLDLVSSKRAITIKRLEMEKINKISKVNAKKIKEMQQLKEDYDQAIKQKEAAKILELEKELQYSESMVRIQKLEEQIIRDEAEHMIKYYDNLYTKSEKKKISIMKHIKALNSVQLDSDKSEDNKKLVPEQEALPITSTSLDVINANVKEIEDKINCDSKSESMPCEVMNPVNSKLINVQSNESCQVISSLKTSAININKPLTEVQKNKLKAMKEEMDIVVNGNKLSESTPESKEISELKRNKLIVMGTDIGKKAEACKMVPPKPLIEAQRNKLKVLTEEMGILNDTTISESTFELMEISELARNKLRVMGTDIGKKAEACKMVPSKPLTEAQRNKLKVLTEEMGILNDTTISESTFELKEISELARNKLRVMGTDIGKKAEACKMVPSKPLTEAQRNKQKVLTEEMGIEINDAKISKSTSETNVFTELQRNRRKVMGTDIGKKAEVAKMVITKPLTEAQRNKLKVLNVEMGVEGDYFKNQTPKNTVLTEAERNKITVMSTELGLEVKIIERQKSKTLTSLEINRNHNMSTNKCFYGNYSEKFDNENFLNRNVDTFDESSKKTSINDDFLNENYILPPVPLNKHSHLKLDLQPHTGNDTKSSESIFASFMKSPVFEFHKPMSVDSTPILDFSPMTKFSEKYNFDTLSTAASNYTDEGFNFGVEPEISFWNTINSNISKKMSVMEAEKISTNCVNYFIHHSILIPIMAQSDLIQNELLSYFINDLGFLKHLVSLRNYFFFLDGEFGRNITEGLFERLYEVGSPQDLVNCRCLTKILLNALESTSKTNDNSKYLSFKINGLPKIFDLRSIGVLDCISLSYKVNWPLNILLPINAIGKYDEVFKFLLKLHRVVWVLKKIYMELKVMIKMSGTRGPFLLLSPQYQKLQHYRHIMTHFVQTLQNYVVGEVLHTSWVNFEKDLSTVTNLDELYSVHTVYIKTIIFMCLLNQSSAPIRKMIHNAFTVILKFYDFLTSREWEFEEDTFIHPNYSKLEVLFTNFIDCVNCLLKTASKVAKTGYQPQLVQFLNMLDINDFYSRLNTPQKTE